MTAGSYCAGCGKLVAGLDHTRCRARSAATDPPRFCVSCGRKLVVQVLPLSWNARCVRCGPVTHSRKTSARASSILRV